jgi:catalase
MSSYLETTVETPPPPLSVGVKRGRLAVIGLVLAGIAGTFAYLGGWFSPRELTPARFADAFEHADGLHAGFRRNHARGVCVSGFFESNGKGVRLSKACVFESGRVPVIGRFSVQGGNPYSTDRPDNVRGLGLQFSMANGEVWRTTMINLPVFLVRTPESFHEFLIANVPDPASGKPNPARLKEFFEGHPEAVAALEIIKSQPPSSGLANSTFHGLHAFRVTNAAGVSVPVRWILMPLQPVETAGPAPEDKKYLFHDLIAQIHRGPLRWRLILLVGQPGDPTNDASLPWPAEREQVDVGTLTLERVESDDTSAARDILFDPLVLPAGISPSDDPILSARSPIYSQSYTRRSGEAPQPSPITPADVTKGEEHAR